MVVITVTIVLLTIIGLEIIGLKIIGLRQALTSLIHWLHSITARISKPLNLQVSNITHDSIFLKWTKPVEGGDYVTSYTILYRCNDDPIHQWQNKACSVEEKVEISGLQPRTVYFFKVRPEGQCRHGKESNETDPIATKPKYPGKPDGKPTAILVTQHSIILQWGKPEYGADLVISYTIFYRNPTTDSHCKWKKQICKSKNRKAVIDGLEPETKYVFKVIPEGKFGEGPESIMSNPIKTDKILSKRIKQMSEKISKGISPERYVLPMKYAGGRRYTLGEPPLLHSKEKVLMLIGATGSGKTTLLNGIVNYVLGVTQEDNFRFKIKDETDKADEIPDQTDKPDKADEPDKTERNQAHSQTKKVTAYTFYAMDGLCVPYTLTIVDTPGFGDTAGITQDKETVKQMFEFFSIGREYGIDHVNGVGVVVQAPNARLTHTQKYIFDSIQSVLAKDVSSNMFLMVTFVDGSNPPVINAVQEANVPCSNHFKFNNSALFSNPNGDDFVKMFWKLCTKSFQMFFEEFENVKPASTKDTKNVLETRQHLESIIQELQKKITSGLDKINELHNEKKMLEEHKDEMNINENFKYEVQVCKQVTKKLPQNQRALNCLNCFTTCHYHCDKKDDEVYNCEVMNGHGPSVACCTICCFKCPWEMHCLQSSSYESYKNTETRTIKELKQKYDEARYHYETSSSAVDRLEEELSKMQHDVMTKIKQARRCKQNLNKIAMKPGKLTEVEYIDILIVAEKTQTEEGYLERIQALEELKKAAALLAKLSEEGNLPPTHFKISRWWTDFRHKTLNVI